MALQNIDANILLDLYNHDTTPTTVKAIQLDSQTRYVAALLQNGGAQYDIDSGATVQLIVIRPDGVGVQITGTTFTYGDEGAQFLGPYAELTQVALAVSGKMRGQFKLTSGTQILRTEIFTISNGVALDASTDEWADEYDGYNLEEMATSIETNTADIASLEADVNQIKEDLSDMVNSACVTDSASGAVAHFEDGANDVPMKSVKVNIDPVQSGSGDPSPSNVRAISGWGTVKVTRCGKNLLQCPTSGGRTNSGITWTYNSDGSVTASGTATGNSWSYANPAIVILPQGTYTVSVTSPFGMVVQNLTDGGYIYNGGNYSQVTFTLSKLTRVGVHARIGNGTTIDATTGIQIEIGDTATTFEPYNGDAYEVSLSDAGTVYGGTLDVVSGVLTVDRKYELFDGSSDEAWQFLTESFGKRCGIVRNDVLNTGSRVEVDANEGVYSASANTVGTVFASGVSIYYYPPATVTTLEEYKSWLASNPLQVVYPLATPQTYQLTPQQVKSLLGINNIWSDAGDVDVEYRADTKLYIEKLTEPDADMIADANIVSGQYFMVGNSLYKATANIASGASVIVGTNCTRKSLSEALNEINA